MPLCCSTTTSSVRKDSACWQRSATYRLTRKSNRRSKASSSSFSMPRPCSTSRKYRSTCSSRSFSRARPASLADGRSVGSLGPFDRRSPHQPTLRRREIRARMRRAAVVPEEKVADAPDVLVDKLLPLGVVEYGLEQRSALFPRHVDDADGHQPVDVDRLAVGVLVGAEYRVDALAERLGALAVALQGRAIVVVMDGLASAEPAANRGIERVVGGIAARKQRMAAAVGNFDRVKQGRLVGHFGVDHVVVEHHLAVRQGSDRLAVLADVRDEHDPGQEPRVPLWKESWRSARHAHLAEIARDADEVFLPERLARGNDHEGI